MEDDEEAKEAKDVEAGGLMSKLNCCKGKKEEEERIRDVERAAGKVKSSKPLSYIIMIPGPSLYTSDCWTQASSWYERACAIVLTRAQYVFRTSDAPLNYFAGCPAFFTMFSFTVKLMVNFKSNFSHEF